ncbi:hypothetical protein [Stutzerimonas frequens]|uniref:Uncharacterized protein n=1 Tax=Stutzerimonas frequens TaxID=2968969 RepID=A0ABX6XY13_9GAMM|nr:hypothetical protein [Stutzerimonas frequens]MCQ4302782.1 hypothetical protein [Stutzerimonas frequens]QPT18943.1 hypothetical protein I6G34_06155 [Stutzerimonas frequens]
MSDFEQNQKNIDGLSKLGVPVVSAPPQVNLEYMRIGGKQSSLVNAQRGINTALQNGKISIKFSEPIWIYDLTVWIKEEDKSKARQLTNHVSVRLVYARGGEREIPLNVFERYLDCYPKDFLIEIEIKFFDIKRTIFSKPPACEKIQITGLNADDFSEFCTNTASTLEIANTFSNTKIKLLGELKELNNQISESDTAALEKNKELAEVISDLERNREKLSHSEIELSRSEAKVGVLNKQSADLEQRLRENERLNQHLIENIQDNREELQALLANKNVFMEEFSAYVEQGKGNINSYFWVGGALLLVVAFCLWRLVASAVALSNDPAILETVSAFDLFVSRLPLAFLLGSVMIICLRILFVLLSKVFEIHQERLLLAKLSILAKDNSFFSANGLDIAGELIYNKRVSLKMELLKEFLAGNYRGAVEKESEIKNSFQKFKDDFIKAKAAEAKVDEASDELNTK